MLIQAENAGELARALQMIMENIGSYSPEDIRKQALLRYGCRTVMEQYRQLILQVLEKQSE